MRLSGSNSNGTVRHFGTNFSPNGKHYACEWVQSATMNVKSQRAQPSTSVESSWAGVRKDD